MEIGAGPGIRASFAFARHTQAGSAIDTGGNAQIDGLMALDAALPAAIRATLLDNLACALARRASAGNGEKSLLVRKLPTPSATLASACAGSGFRAGSVARAAQLLLRQFNFCGNARSSFFKSQRHVVTQIRATLRASSSAPPAAAHHIFETKEIAKNVVEVLENRAVEIHAASAAGLAQSGVPVGIVDLPLFLIA